MAKKNRPAKDADSVLPLGEERDGLRDNADRILSKGQPKQPTYKVPNTRRRPWDPEDGDISLELPGYFPLRDDERIMRERGSYVPRNPFGGGRDSDLEQGTGGFEAPFTKLAGRVFTKREFMMVISQDLPRLLREAAAEETVRGKLLRGTLVPALRDLMHDLKLNGEG